MVMIASGISTPGANTKTVDLITGQYQYVQKGVIRLLTLASAAGINATLMVNGVAIVNDLPIVMFATSGTMKQLDNTLVEQLVLGGRVEFYLRNTTATAGTTCDYQIFYEPTK